jgi:hypothetical protein
MFATLKSIAIKTLGIAALTGAAALAIGVPSASAQPNDGNVPGVNIENLWLHCNAAGGEYSEGYGWALCQLPSGQTVFCSSTSCWLSAVTTDPSPGKAVLHASQLGVGVVQPVVTAPAGPGSVTTKPIVTQPIMTQPILAQPVETQPANPATGGTTPDGSSPIQVGPIQIDPIPSAPTLAPLPAGVG